MKPITLFLLISSFTNNAIPQQSDSFPHFVFLPAGMHFGQLRASSQEPRVGVLKFLDAEEMKVDIGNTIDVFGLNFSHSRFTAGIDFFAYAFVTGAEGLRLQIDAIDGFFGGNITYDLSLEDGVDGPPAQIFARLRVLHHSAHYVDGHYLPSSTSPPGAIPFTQDFGELVLAHLLSARDGYIRYYGGISYATLVRPTDIQRFALLGGIELTRNIGQAFEQPSNLYLAYNAALNGTPAYSLSHQVQVGVKFGKWFSKGPSIYLAYYTGRHIFGEYFNERISTIGAGFTIDFN